MSPLQIIGGIKTNGPIQIPVLSEGAEFLTVEAFLGNFSAEQQPKVKECFKNERTFATETPGEAEWAAAVAAYNTVLASPAEGITTELMAQASKFVLLLFFVEEALGLHVEVAKEPKDQYAHYVRAVETAISAAATQATSPVVEEPATSTPSTLPAPVSPNLPANAGQLQFRIQNAIVHNKAALSTNEHLKAAMENLLKALQSNDVSLSVINAEWSQLATELDAQTAVTQ